jgi:hypothetical protein
VRLRWQGTSAELIAVVVLVHGCGAQVFACDDPSECPGGTCESSGFCSFPDDACPSGQRYGGHAPSSIANECVEPQGTSSGDDTTTTTSAGTTVTLTTIDASGDPSGTSDPSTTTTTTTSGSVDETTTSTSEGGLPPDVPPELPPCVVEQFDDDMIEGFDWWSAGPTESVVDGALTVALTTTPAAAGLDFAGPGFVERDAVVTVLDVPNQAEATQVALAVGTDGAEMLILHEDGMLVVRYDDGMTFENRAAVMPLVPSTWRIRSHDGSLSFERDDGNGGWEMLWSETPPFDLEQARAFVYFNTWQDTVMPGSVTIDDLSDCPYQ